MRGDPSAASLTGRNGQTAGGEKIGVIQDESVTVLTAPRPGRLFPALQSQKAVSAYLSSKQLLPFGFALHCKRELVPRLGRRAICVLVPLWSFMTRMSPPTSCWLIIRPISPFYHPRLLNQTLFTHGSSFNHIS